MALSWQSASRCVIGPWTCDSWMSLLNPSLPRGSPAGNVLKRMSKNATPCGLPSAFVSSGAFDGTICAFERHHGARLREGHRLTPFLRGDEVQGAELIVLAPASPVRQLGHPPVGFGLRDRRMPGDRGHGLLRVSCSHGQRQHRRENDHARCHGFIPPASLAARYDNMADKRHRRLTTDNDDPRIRRRDVAGRRIARAHRPAERAVPRGARARERAAGVRDSERAVDVLVEQHLPVSHAALQAASRGLFFSLPVAFNPAESVGPYLAVVDRDAAGQPYRFLDMGALIATQAFGENDPAVVRAVLESLPFVTSRYAHSEYQTVLSLRLKAELNRIAPAGTPRHFIVNTGAEAVENAIKSVLMNRVMTSPDGDGGFIVSFDGRVPRPHAGRPRRHAPQEGAPGLPDVRLAAHLFSGRGSCDRRKRPRGARSAASSSCGICWCPAGCRTPRRARTRSGARWTRIDEFLAAEARGPGRTRQRVRAGATRQPDARCRSAVADAWRRCSSSRFRARAACAWRARASCASCGS